MTFYRAMRADDKDRPVIAAARWGLGVRTEGDFVDVYVDGKGFVAPLGGGLSGSDDWRGWRESFIPEQLGGSNTTETLFSLEEDEIPGALTIRWMPPPDDHFEIQPRRKMPIHEYEALLGGTQDLWKQVTA